MVTETKYKFLFENAPVPLWEEDISRLNSYFASLKSRGVYDLRQLFIDDPDEVIKCAQLLKHRKVNHAALKLWGAKSITDFDMRRPSWRKLPMLDYIKENLIALFNGERSFGREEQSINLNGETIYYHGNNVVCDLPGEASPSFFIGSSYDLTDLKRAESKLHAYNDYLEEMVEERTLLLEKEIKRRKRAEIKAKKLFALEQKARLELEAQMRLRADFFRALVHELKTPLTPMLGASEALSIKMAGGIERKLALNISKGAEQLNRRIDELLDIARGEIGILAISRQMVNIKELIEGVVEEFAPLIQSKRAVVCAKIPPNLPTVSCDYDRTKQVIQNLLNNALRYNPSGVNVCVSVKIKRNNVEFNVKDSGVGLTKEAQNHLFQMYHIQKVGPNMEKLSGLGIGLALCRILIELHGGKIWVKSELGKGATFSFTIPANSLTDGEVLL